jgi:hypothetical protein
VQFPVKAIQPLLIVHRATLLVDNIRYVSLV